MSIRAKVWVLGWVVTLGYLQQDMWGWHQTEAEGVHRPQGGWQWRQGALWPVQGGAGGAGELQ